MGLLVCSAPDARRSLRHLSVRDSRLRGRGVVRSLVLAALPDVVVGRDCLGVPLVNHSVGVLNHSIVAMAASAV